ncbi:MAG: HEAT repeat domain-containing protein, partial [Lentisphaeraceae bacterium]|nr:HEAT repeat domain-containing protein [Lentisphaeraceae bacterium]
QADEGAAEYFGENVRIIAQTGENIVLRMSAVKTLGEIGNVDDVEFLEGLLGHKDKIMVKVARTALEGLKK